MNWTADQVDALAPDSASVSAGRKLANPSKWASMGTTGAALWGECQGSGKNPYQVRIDFNGPAYRCSCPSRKIPCKHCLALFYLYAANGSAFATDNPPEWLTAWLDDRQNRETKKVERAEKKAVAETPEQRAKLQAKRLDKSLEGLEELSLRLCDLVREGLGAAPGKPYQFWDQAARRLMDAQAPGAAYRVRRLAELPTSGEGWPERMLSAMGELCLLVSAARNFESLPLETQADIGAALGWTEKKDSVLAAEGQEDTWHVMAATVEEDVEARLRVRRVWLWGAKTKRAALLLDFAAGSQPFDGAWLPGIAFTGELAFYPGSYPLRAVVKGEVESAPITTPKGYADFDAALSAFADASARNAWLGPFPVVLEDVIPWHANGDWVLIDRTGKAAPVRRDEDVLWSLLAEAGGAPTTLFALWHEGVFCVLPSGQLGGALPSVQGTGGSPRLRQLARGMMLQNDAGEHPLPPAEGPLGNALAGLNGDIPAWRTLQAAAAISAFDTAGWAPPKWSGDTPAPVTADVRPDISAGAIELLAQLASDRLQTLWPEFITLAADSGKKVPARFHPALLECARKRKKSRGEVMQITGGPGAWLAGFREAWTKVADGVPDKDTETPAGDVWETGALEERVAWLRALRERDSSTARELLAEGFKKEPAAARTALIETLDESLSMEDEEFLESALDDKSSRVSAVAASLLRRLPDSRLVRRAIALVEECVKPKKLRLLARLEIFLPEELTPSMTRDGISEGFMPHVGGKKSAMLAQLIAAVPLNHWTSRFSGDPPSLLRRAKATDFESVFLFGWQQAAIREQSTSWLQALLAHSSEKSRILDREQLSEALPGEALEQFALAEMASGVKLTYSNIHGTVRLLEKLPQPWSAAVSRATLAWMRRHAAHTDNHAASYSRQAFERIALLLPPSLLAEAQSGWPDTGPAWETLTKNDEHFLILLKTRYQLNREFEK